VNIVAKHKRSSIAFMQFRKPETIPLLFIICSTLMLSGLGLWQVERLQWKNELIAQIEKAQAEPVLSALTEELYRRVELSGTWVLDKTLHVVGKPQLVNGNGYFLLTPLTLGDGKSVLVNRGWVPSGWKDDSQKHAQVSGVIRPARGKRLFTPENYPEKNIWFYEDIAAMEAATGLALEDAVVEAVGPRNSTTYPYPSDGKISLRNDHLGYAITWFGLAFIGIFMFGAYHRKYD
jgi:surfeit locus 1 family protein